MKKIIALAVISTLTYGAANDITTSPFESLTIGSASIEKTSISLPFTVIINEDATVFEPPQDSKIVATFCTNKQIIADFLKENFVKFFQKTIKNPNDLSNITKNLEIACDEHIIETSSNVDEATETIALATVKFSIMHILANKSYTQFNNTEAGTSSIFGNVGFFCGIGNPWYPEWDSRQTTYVVHPDATDRETRLTDAALNNNSPKNAAQIVVTELARRLGYQGSNYSPSKKTKLSIVHFPARNDENGDYYTEDSDY